jgi:hypothetical protein
VVALSRRKYMAYYDPARAVVYRESACRNAFRRTNSV